VNRRVLIEIDDTDVRKVREYLTLTKGTPHSMDAARRYLRNQLDKMMNQFVQGIVYALPQARREHKKKEESCGRVA
jgi:hypothetical protein